MYNYSSLSPEQKYAFEKIKQRKNVFITGPGGTGKSYLIKFISQWAKNSGVKTSICAMTGCAAILLDCNAKTIHSWSGIRLAKGEPAQVINSVLRSASAMKPWKKTSLLILDEVSMLSSRILEILDSIGKAVRKNSLPFGGIQLVFCGDFYQLPPIQDAESGENTFCFEHPLWETLFPRENWIELTTLFRQKDPAYISVLMEVRKGKISEESKRVLLEASKKKFQKEKEGDVVPTKLFPVRSKVDKLNDFMFEQLTTMEYEYEYVVKTDCSVYMDGNNTPISVFDIKKTKDLSDREKEFEVKSLTTQSQIPTVLSLKKGATVMCTYNINLELGICNGSQGVIVDFISSSNTNNCFCDLPVVLFSNGVQMPIPIIYFHSEEYPSIVVGQIPLCLAWALTIHKIQGATMDKAEIDIGSSIFECGQTYVALSRIKTLEGLYLSSFNPNRIFSNPKVVAFYERFPKIEKEQMEHFLEQCQPPTQPSPSPLPPQLNTNTNTETNTKKIIVQQPYSTGIGEAFYIRRKKTAIMPKIQSPSATNSHFNIPPPSNNEKELGFEQYEYREKTQPDIPATISTTKKINIL